VKRLHASGYRGKRGRAYIQSFEVANLQELRGMTRLPLVQLINCAGQPWDFAAAADPRTYPDLVTPAGLDSVGTYAAGIAVCKDLVISRDGAGNLTTPMPVVADAHARRLVVHTWTFRAENQFLPANLRSGADPNTPGDLATEISAFLDAKVDGYFTDHTGIATGRGRRAQAGR
jgi:glycerophosphoryl diester phosphodiesterase